MGRQPLIHIPQGLYSVVSKCNNDEFLFDAPEKFEMYLHHLLECKKHFGFLLYDIVCMSNHVHELYRVPEDVTISQILQRVKGQFARKFNHQFCRKNHFWKNKPYYRIVENEEYALATMNYFHWNPVKAGMVDSPEKWPFSGYRFHVFNERDGLIGKLLDPLDQKVNASQYYFLKKGVEAALQANQPRFLGSADFIRRVSDTTGVKKQ